MSNKKVLIGCCGGFSGIYLSKQFKKFKDFTILGFDTNVQSAASLFCKQIFKLPSVNDDSFLQELINLINREHIDFYVPTYSKEMILIAQNQEILTEKTSVKFIISPYKTYQLLNNKFDANTSLKQIGIPVPQMYNKSNCKFPVIIKPMVGSGSSGIVKITNKEDFEKYSVEEDFLLMEYIEGEEFTVDCFFSDGGELLGYNQRRRIKSLHGAVIITQNDNSFDIYPYLFKIISSFEFKGCVNFQYILRDGLPFFIDVNLRFAAGGLPLSVESGLNVPLAMRKIFLDRHIRKNEFKSDCKNRTMYRYFEEKFVVE